jgi:uncharacterized phage protein (TIGR01671 family)
MSREIKFRAWDNYEKKMWYPRTIGEGFIKMSGLMQFTGLLDKNGVEIYEGDILKSNKDMFNYYTEIQPEILYQVKYTDGAYRLFSTDNQNIDLLDMANINSKIVGNIYENPELLGTKSDIAVDIGFKEATNE